MKNKYTSDEILKMAVKKLAADPEADLDGDGHISAADARLALIDETKQKSAEKSAAEGNYEYVPDEKLSLMSSSLLDRIMSDKTGEIEINADKLYNSYRDMYSKNASLAAENVFGLASSLTGGYGNSYAASAASEAYNKYMSSLTDRALEIEKLSDKRRETQLSDLYKAYDTVNGLEDKYYKRYSDTLDLAFKAAKLGDYSLLDKYGIDTSKLAQSDALEKAETAAKYGDYDYLEDLGINTNSLYQKEKLQKAVQAAEYGDYSYLDSLGINTSTLRYNELLKTASEIAGFGDYSALELLGVDVSKLIEDDDLEKALQLAKYGDYSLLGSFSENLSGLKQKIGSSIQKGAQEAYAYGGYSSLVRYLDRQVGYGQINDSAKKQIIAVVTGGRYAA
ncbi:MAG: hypothetical protein IJS90_02345 [Clostridia bacterium]|nr:hypothetical protein [Clostridia bacterium]